MHNTYSNIAYTLHFYAAANHDGYKSNGTSAMASAPIFITEWGASDASGDGNISDASSWRSGWIKTRSVAVCGMLAQVLNHQPCSLKAQLL